MENIWREAVIVDGVTKHKCPVCGREDTCIEAPEECWGNFHGCRECNLSFGDEQMGISKEVAECPLCTAAAMETPEAVFAGGRADDPTTFVILQTKNMKGHEWRYMILTTKHVADIPNVGQAEAYLYYYMRLRGITAFDIMEPTHATIADHWHRVASDTYTGDDRDLIMRTDRVQILVKKDARDRE